MNVGGCDMGLGNQVVFAAGGAVIETKETLRFALTHQVTTLRVGGA